MSKLAVFHYVVGTPLPQWREVHNDLKELQDLVDGYIEMVRMRNGFVCICNEEGLLRRLPCGFAVNSTVGLQPIRGNFFVCRISGSKFKSVRESDILTVMSEVIAR